VGVAYSYRHDDILDIYVFIFMSVLFYITYVNDALQNSYEPTV